MTTQPCGDLPGRIDRPTDDDRSTTDPVEIDLLQARELELALLERARSGDAEAFAELYRRHAPRAHAEARRLLRRHADVDDVVSCAFSSVFLAMQQGRGPTHAFRAYLLVAVRNAINQLTRSRRYRHELALDDVDANRRVEEDDGGLSPALVLAFRNLPPRWRAVLWQSHVEGLSNQEIGARIGLSSNGVAALSKRARAGLRESYRTAAGTEAAPG